MTSDQNSSTSQGTSADASPPADLLSWTTPVIEELDVARHTAGGQIQDAGKEGFNYRIS